jgi:hypothetical protein
MRITVVLPDDLLRRVKATAALERKSLREFIAQALVHEMDKKARTNAPGRRVKLPLVRSKRPGCCASPGSRCPRLWPTRMRMPEASSQGLEPNNTLPRQADTTSTDRISFTA